MVAVVHGFSRSGPYPNSPVGGHGVECENRIFPRFRGAGIAWASGRVCPDNMVYSARRYSKAPANRHPSPRSISREIAAMAGAGRQALLYRLRRCGSANGILPFDSRHEAARTRSSGS